MPNYKVPALVAAAIILTAGLYYKDVTAQVPSEVEDVNQLEIYENNLKTGNYKVTVVMNTPGESTEKWVNNINKSSYYLSDGQLTRIDAHSTETSLLFLESGTYLLDSKNRTYNLYTDKSFYPEIVLDLEKNSPEILQIYNIFLKSIQWVEFADYTWESGEPVVVNDNEDIKLLKMWMYLSKTEPLIEKIVLIDENDVQQDVILKYEDLSNEEILEAANFGMYSASLL